MGEETQGERIAVLETKVTALEKALETRSAREWAIIATGLGLVMTIIAQYKGLL